MEQFKIIERDLTICILRLRNLDLNYPWNAEDRDDIVRRLNNALGMVESVQFALRDDLEGNEIGVDIDQ
jgi:hypothetical protein